VEAAHFEHGIRVEGGASQKDADFVAGFCEERGIACTIAHGDVPAYAEARKLSIETAARKCRYDFLEKTRRERGLDLIATAHQADDQAETVLMRLLRGTGTTGLAAMRPRAEGELPLIRPLLFAPRAAIEAYCEARGLSPRQDATNELLDCTRNKLRLKTLPMLKEEYNPRLFQALCQLADICAVETDYVNSQAEAAFAGLHSSLGLETGGFRKLHQALQWAVIRLFWQQETGSGQDLPYAHVQRLCRVLTEGHAGSQQQLPHGYCLRLCRKDKMLYARLNRGEVNPS
jgi:tRNA(Ile)-lysidine synthase